MSVSHCWFHNSIQGKPYIIPDSLFVKSFVVLYVSLQCQLPFNIFLLLLLLLIVTVSSDECPCLCIHYNISNGQSIIVINWFRREGNLHFIYIHTYFYINFYYFCLNHFYFLNSFNILITYVWTYDWFSTITYYIICA